MINRRLDKNWDYTFGGGANNFLSGKEAVAQAVISRLKLFLGEWWANRNDGIPMFQSILGYGGSNKDSVDRLITQRILGTQNVTSIENIVSSYDPNTRAYTFTAIIDTAFGQIALSNSPLGA